MFSKEELINFNELMLGRGMPVQEDGIGYSQADYGTCASYFYGLSDAQYADLSKRLVKYTKTQLNVSKEDMKETAKYFEELAGGKDRSAGVSLNITEKGSLISFRFNEEFIRVIQKQPIRKYDHETKKWIVPNDKVLSVLHDLEKFGADVKNALEYAKSHELVNVGKTNKCEIHAKIQDGMIFLTFNYNKFIVEKIKEIDYKNRKYNPQIKTWSIKPDYFNTLKESLSDIAEFKIA